MKNNHNLLMKMKNLEKFSGAIKRCVAIAMASMLFATTGFSLDTHPVKAQEVSSSADKIEIPEISKDAFKKYKKISGIGANTILGADFTYYQQCLEWGKSYKNYMSQSVDNIFDYVKSQGINTISLKVAVNPTGENAYLSLENAIKTLKAVKASNTNLKTNLVLLYYLCGYTESSGRLGESRERRAIGNSSRKCKNLYKRDNCKVKAGECPS